MTVVAGAAAVPAAPLLLPQVSPGVPAADAEAVARLRDAVAATVDALPDADVVVLIGSGPRGFRERARSSLRPLGIVADDVVLPVDAELLTHATRITQYPVLIGGGLAVDNAVLARLAHRRYGDIPVLPVSVAPETDGQVLVNIGAGLVEALRDTHRAGAVLATSDLSAGLGRTSPRYDVAGAAAWDQLVLRAVGSGDVDALAALGPAEAARVHGRGWGPLTVLGGLAAAARLHPVEEPGYDVVRGVGRLWLRLGHTGSPDVGGVFRRDGTAPLTLPRGTER
ncbi:MAG: hypothetical protein KY457_07995 [Actinobacteria bacterium]|nr:hypothetical protein [Actinomycetota bacterium]